MNKLSKLLLLLLIIGGLSSCSVEGGNSSKVSSSSSEVILPSSSSDSTNNTVSTPNLDEKLSIDAQLFINNVYNLDVDNISISDKGTIDGARYIYSTLNEEDKLLPEVIEAKEHLDMAINYFNTIYDEFISQREAEETGYAFAEQAEKYGNLNALVREDLELINELLAKYNLLSESAKDLSVVTEAKTNLDAAKEYVESLASLSDDEYAIIQFTASINKLPSYADLTIFDVDAVNAANDLYISLSSEAKSNSKVIIAKYKLDSLLGRANALLAIQANADAFIKMVWALPTFDKLEWKSSAQNSQISAAENAYNKLTDEEKQVTGVSSAFDQLQAVRAAFDGLKEPYDISKLGFSMNLGAPINIGGVNYTSEFTYVNGKDHISVLTSQYGIPREELTQHVTVYLNMYIEAGAVESEPLYQFDITEDWSNLNYYTYAEILKELAKTDERVYSGMGICFTLSIQSLNDNYASSKYSSFMGRQKIHWEV